MFFVITLKTDSVNKPHAIHLTKLKEKYRQKAVFQSFLKNHAETPKEYYVESLQKKGKPRNFYSKQAALNTVRKLADEHGYHVRLPKNTWGVYKKLEKVRKKPRANEQYVVQTIPTDQLRNLVVKSIEVDSPIDATSDLMFELNIPVFSISTRMNGMWNLLRNCGAARNELTEEVYKRLDQYNKKRGMCGTDHSGNSSRAQDRGFQLLGWDAYFFQKKRIVNAICGRLTKLYAKTPGSRLHTVDAVEAVEVDPSIKSTPVIKVI